MARTRRWLFVGQEARRLHELGLSGAEIARRLGVHRASVCRWLKAGKLAPIVKPKIAATAARLSPAEWADAVRNEYDLDVTDQQLVALAEMALTMSRDSTVAPRLQLLATARFQALVRQLSLVTRQPEAPSVQPPIETPAKPAPRRTRWTGPDPRALLTVVKRDSEPA